MSTVYDLYQSYLNQLQNPVFDSQVTGGITMLPQVQPMVTSESEDNTNIFRVKPKDYTQVPGMFEQYMKPAGIMDYFTMTTSPILYGGIKAAQYGIDQQKLGNVMEQGIGFGGATSEDRAGGGGFGGDTAGGFDPSEPTATEGSF